MMLLPSHPRDAPCALPHGNEAARGSGGDSAGRMARPLPGAGFAPELSCSAGPGQRGHTELPPGEPTAPIPAGCPHGLGGCVTGRVHTQCVHTQLLKSVCELRKANMAVSRGPSCLNNILEFDLWNHFNFSFFHLPASSLVQGMHPSS